MPLHVTMFWFISSLLVFTGIRLKQKSTRQLIRVHLLRTLELLDHVRELRGLTRCRPIRRHHRLLVSSCHLKGWHTLNYEVPETVFHIEDILNVSVDTHLSHDCVDDEIVKKLLGVKPGHGGPNGGLNTVFQLPKLLLLSLLLLELALILENSHWVLIVRALVRPTLHGVAKAAKSLVGEPSCIPRGSHSAAISTVDFPYQFI